MAIVQISKIIHRTGANIDLPQLDTGEIGFATNDRKLYIGNDPLLHDIQGSNLTTQTEILTETSLINVVNTDPYVTDPALKIKAKISGLADSSFNLANFRTGQLLVGNSSGVTANTIVNWTGNKLGSGATIKLQLGSISNISITGGMSGGLLSTDGNGNLTWTPSSGIGSSLPAQDPLDAGNVLVTDGTNARWANIYEDTRLADAIRGNINVTDNGGDGSISYDPVTGNVIYTGPSATEVISHFSGANGVTVSASGVISTPQPLSTTSDVTFANISVTNLTINGFNPTSPGGVGNIVFADSANVLQTDSSLTYDPVTNELSVGSILASGNITTVNALFGSNLQTVTQTSTTSSDGKINGIPAGKTGQIIWDANYIYVCIAPFQWKRVALSAF